jgi:hypothetical protein
VGATTHLPHQALFLDLAAKLAKRLLEVLRVLDDYLQKPITSFFNYRGERGAPARLLHTPMSRPRIIAEPGIRRHSIPRDAPSGFHGRATSTVVSAW